MTTNRATLARLAAKYRIPGMYGHNLYPKAGGLMSYGPSLDDLYRGAASYVDNVLRGSKPADLPVEQPVRFHLIINLKTAKELGLSIPQKVLTAADEVIEGGGGCLLLALGGHAGHARQCPLLGVERTSHFTAEMSAFDPKRT